MEDNIYEKLRAKIDEYSVGFNSTKSGIEIKILQKMFTEDEALIYLNLSIKLETALVIAERVGQDEVRVKDLLEGMTAKGLTFPRSKNGKRYFAAAPLMHGIFENSALTKMDSELAKMFDLYIENGFAPKVSALKTVPINIIADNRGSVLPFDDVKEIIMKKERIGLLNCACKTKTLKLGSKCSSSLDVCIGFDYYAEYVIEEYRQGRWITREEALDVLKKAEIEGLVHQVGGSAENIECICNCCSDCCMSMKVVRRLPNPAKAVKSNYRTRAIPGRCFQCGTCIRRCPMDALSLNDNGIVPDYKRCIGCGLCVTSCAAGAIELYRKPDNEVRGFIPSEKYKFMRSSNEFDKDVK